MVFRSTKKTNKRDALAAAVDMERAARREAGESDEISRRILSVINRATEYASRGKLTAPKGREFIIEIVKIATGEDMPDYTIKEWFAEWMSRQEGLAESSVNAYKTFTNNFLEWLGPRENNSVETILPEDIRQYRQWLITGGLGRKASTNTVAGKIKGITSIFKAAMEQGLIDSNPCTGLKQLPPDKSLTRKPFTIEEVNKLILHAPDDEWRGVITLAAFTGLRMGDCLRLKWDDVFLEAGLIKTIPSKTKRSNKEVKIPIHPTLKVYLESLKHQTGDVFPKLSQMGLSGRLGASTVFTKIMATAGVSRGKSQNNGSKKNYERSFHSLRHTLISWLANSNVSPEVRMKIVGHSNEDIHALYTHIEDNTLTIAMGGIPLLNQ